MLSLRITPDLGMLERHNLYMSVPWISLHPKINYFGSRKASFLPEMTSRWVYSECSSMPTPVEVLYTQLSTKQRQRKDGQITLRIKLDFHKCYTIQKPVSRALTSVKYG